MKRVKEILNDHVTLKVESFDRLYLNGYIPKLQTNQQINYFLSWHRKNPVASPALCLFLHTHNGFSNRSLRKYVAQLLGIEPKKYGSAQMSYDLRRLRLKGVIIRINTTHRYHLTTYGMNASIFLTRLHSRLLRPGLSVCENQESAPIPHPLRRALDKVNSEVDAMIEKSSCKLKQTP